MPRTIERKKCSKCGKRFPNTTEFFHPNRKRVDGSCSLRSACRTCRNQERRENATKRKARLQVQERKLRELTSPTQSRSPEISDVNKRAILRLIQKHRTEFEFYVFEEERRQNGTVRRQGQKWVSIDQAFTEDEDREVLPEFAI